MQKLYADLLVQELAPATVRQLHAVLRRAFGHATKWGTVARNVVALASPPRVRRHEMPPLSATQARATIDRGKRSNAYAWGLLGRITTYRGLTLDTYSHVIPDMQQQTVVAMDALLKE